MKPTIFSPDAESPAELRPAGACLRGRIPRAQSGVALVVTLIMLSVITFMAITFLVLSRSEHGAVAVETDQTQALLAAETGLQRAIAQALAPIMAQNNEFNYGLLVSTNYVNPLGFAPGIANPTNVNYDYKVNGSRTFNYQEWAQNIDNLWFDPRPPVFITNRFSPLGGYEFRFFHNLNRNTNLLGAVFDPTGWLAVTNNGQPVGTLFDWFNGDPQWIGILNSPDRPHAPDNRFVSRFAYLVVPAGSALDLNYIHNQAARPDKTALDPNGGDFLRNQGVGTWEGNLAGFLCDLNTNVWDPLGDYRYNPLLSPNPPPTTGTAFVDAFSLIRYRYGCSPTDLTLTSAKLPSFLNLFPNGQLALNADGIDDYAAGPLMGATWPPTIDPDVSPIVRGTHFWSGANNTNHFFTPQELFDPAKTSPGFVSRLMAAGNDTTSSYNEYTFYRMMGQLGSDSAGDAGRINLNYCNLDYLGRAVPNMETNFLPWLPEQFFTNTANALFRTYGYNFSITNIQIYPTNFYTPNVHRLLQLAANIYDASTNRLGGTNNLPTVFRPIFRQVVYPNGVHGVVIAGYRESTNDIVARLNANFPGGPPNAVLGYNHASVIPMFGLADRGDSLEPQVQGIPLVIGAKKGLPNFNEFAMEAQVSISRKLQFRRLGTSSTSSIETNQMYLISITNTFGLEAWNSYLSAYPRNLQVRMDGVMLAVITNEFGTLLSNAVPFQPAGAPIAAGKWSGYGYPNDISPNSFRAVVRSFLFLTNSMYSDPTHSFVVPSDFERNTHFPIPHWVLSLRPMVRFALVDTSVVPNRIVDYVSLDAPQMPTDLNSLLMSGGQCGFNYAEDGAPGSMWCTNRDNGSQDVRVPTYGIRNQIGVGLGLISATQWGLTSDRQKQVDFFRAQFGLSPMFYTSSQFDLTNTFDAPYSPLRSIDFYIPWQANDPLVHYTVPDLFDQLSGSTNSVAGGMAYELDVDPPAYAAMKELGGIDFYSNSVAGMSYPVNSHYRPWGGNPRGSSDTAPVATNWRLEVKDPLVTRSDAWDFPTNKYPNIGWLGRVHRGTPWQTVYLKATTNDWSRWRYWSGDTTVAFNYDALGRTIAMPDSVLSLPEGDRAILDLFSTAVNDNAAHGRLSVNQNGLAAWSAILSGVVVLTNTVNDTDLRAFGRQPQLAAPNLVRVPLVIPPAGQFNPYSTPTNFWPALARVVNGINTTRNYHADIRGVWWNYFGTNVWTNTFEHVGDVLAVPELTVASPYINQGRLINNSIQGLDQGRYTYQQSVGLNDEMYERIPQQILGLLQCDHTPRFVIYAYGQALKPADHSVINSGPFFQLCTNYQITAEVATRAVVRIDGAPKHPHAVIENFNVLPPD